MSQSSVSTIFSSVNRRRNTFCFYVYAQSAQRLKALITKLASFPSKSLNITVINSFLEKLSTRVTVKSILSTRIDFLLLTSVTRLRAITMCSAFTPDCGYDKSTIILIGHVYCPNTKCSGKLCLHKNTKRLSNHWAEALINV